jgi:hypothetical protein
MFMWKRIMGDTVLNATMPTAATALDPSVRVYAHCGDPPSVHAVGAVDGVEGLGRVRASMMGLVFININATQSKNIAVQLSADAHIQQEKGAAKGAAFISWTLTAGADGVFGRTTLLNGKPLPTMFAAGGAALEKIPVPGVEQSTGSMVLPPFSVTFATAPAACTGQ